MFVDLRDLRLASMEITGVVLCIRLVQTNQASASLHARRTLTLPAPLPLRSAPLPTVRPANPTACSVGGHGGGNHLGVQVGLLHKRQIYAVPLLLRATSCADWLGGCSWAE